MKEREGKELHVMSHKMHLRLQKSKKAVSQGKEKFSIDLFIYQHDEKATRDVCLELGNSQRPVTSLFKGKKQTKKK